MHPFDLIEVSTKRANALRRTLLILASEEFDDAKITCYTDAARHAERMANELYDLWNNMLNASMDAWEARAQVTAAQFTNANAQLKRAITNLETAMEKVEGVARAIEKLEDVVGIVLKIAGI